MIQLTDNAATELQAMLSAYNAPPGQALKLAPAGQDQVEMTISEPADGDDVVFQGETPVLIVDSRLTEFFDGKIMDVQPVEVGDERQLRFTIQ